MPAALTEEEITAAALALSPEARGRLAARLAGNLHVAGSEQARNAASSSAARFWEQPRSEAVDKVFDWLLANHVAMREESIERGEPL